MREALIDLLCIGDILLIRSIYINRYYKATLMKICDDEVIFKVGYDTWALKKFDIQYDETLKKIYIPAGLMYERYIN